MDLCDGQKNIGDCRSRANCESMTGMRFQYDAGRLAFAAKSVWTSDRIPNARQMTKRERDLSCPLVANDESAAVLRVESFMSGLKRTTGSALSARGEHALFIEASLRVLAYALRL